MVDYLPRSAWKARPPNGGPGSLTVSRVEGAVIHWPGSASKTPITSQAAVASALRGWQNFHMDTRGWSDIAYQVAVDNAGRAWTLRGLRTQSGANGNNDLNERYGAILLVLIEGEQPSAAMNATVRGVIADFRDLYPKGTAIKPHSAVRPAGTDCPGDAARAAITRGAFTPKATQTPPATEGPTVTLTPADHTAIRADVQAENEEYAVRFWVAPGGTGTAIRALLVEMKLQLDRIEDDTDGAAVTQALIEQIDKNVAELKSRPVQSAEVQAAELPKA